MSDRSFDEALREWDKDGSDRTPSRAIDAVLLAIKTTPQERDLGIPWRFSRMPAFSRASTLAAVALLAVVGAGVLYLSSTGPGGVGGQPPNPSPTVLSTPQALRAGRLEPGSYAARPLPAPRDALTLTFTVPEGWEAFGGDTLYPAGDPGPEAPGGMGILFLDVTTINSDPCKWLGDDDVRVGPEVDDLVVALRAQTAYEVSDPVDVTVGGYSGKRIDIVSPTEPFDQTNSAPECDEGVFTLWSTTRHGATPIYVQGPANRWQTNILDVDGTRLVIVLHDFPATSAEDRAKAEAIIESLVIEP